MAEQLQEIPRNDWIRFLDEFSREHQGWQVAVEVQDRNATPNIQAHDLPLQGISADRKNAGNDISIMIGSENNPGLTHIISGARRLRVGWTGAGNVSILELESADGTRTVLRFRQATKAA